HRAGQHLAESRGHHRRLGLEYEFPGHCFQRNGAILPNRSALKLILYRPNSRSRANFDTARVTRSTVTRRRFVALSLPISAPAWTRGNFRRKLPPWLGSPAFGPVRGGLQRIECVFEEQPMIPILICMTSS